MIAEKGLYYLSSIEEKCYIRINRGIREDQAGEETLSVEERIQMLVNLMKYIPSGTSTKGESFENLKKYMKSSAYQKVRPQLKRLSEAGSKVVDQAHENSKHFSVPEDDRFANQSQFYIRFHIHRAIKRIEDTRPKNDSMQRMSKELRSLAEEINVKLRMNSNIAGNAILQFEKRAQSRALDLDLRELAMDKFQVSSLALRKSICEEIDASAFTFTVLAEKLIEQPKLARPKSLNHAPKKPSKRRDRESDFLMEYKRFKQNNTELPIASNPKNLKNPNTNLSSQVSCHTQTIMKPQAKKIDQNIEIQSIETKSSLVFNVDLFRKILKTPTRATAPLLTRDLSLPDPGIISCRVTRVILINMSYKSLLQNEKDGQILFLEDKFMLGVDCILSEKEAALFFPMDDVEQATARCFKDMVNARLEVLFRNLFRFASINLVMIYGKSTPAASNFKNNMISNLTRSLLAVSYTHLTLPTIYSV
eukprot:TRINITY_DN4658_c0_g1_i13.p1 TRINITY_DN4658_c0_g1~~TRINITY_DN4658_c0_g1_i13.p1  ORF type:complete len:477 (-),score=56.63 TRINITY_DN4658_c0_g1_i13:49-1479(-)